MANLKHLKYNLIVLLLSTLLLANVNTAFSQDTLAISNINSDTTNTNNSKDTTINEKAVPKSDLETTIIYSARDSIWFSVKDQIVILNGDAHVTYGDIQLEADLITINYNTGQINASYTTDSLGKKIGIPHFIDDDDEYFAEEIGHNYKTGRGTVSRILTRQNEGWIRGQKTVKTKDNILYIRNGEFCPCEDSTATTFIRANKIKIIPEKRIVTGPAVLYVGDVPTPLIMPFGLFPASGRKTSGVIVPRQFGEIDGQGFYLRDGGYYWAVNDYLGVEFLGEIYSNGGWGLETKGTYASRYKYDGYARAKFRRYIDNADEAALRTEQDDYLFHWYHTPKSRGSKRFTADVNFESSTYNTNNEIITSNFLKNSVSSNISYYTPLGKNSPFSVNIKLRHSQNNIEETVDMTLPDISLNMARRLPFKEFKRGQRNILYDFIRSTGVAYTMTFQNKMDNKEKTTSFPFRVANPGDVNLEFEEFDLARLFARAQYGVQHRIPISTSMKLGNSFTLNPSFTYTENWYPQRYDYDYAGGDSVNVKETEGFNRASWYSTAVSLNTSYYMTYSFKGKSESKLRHVLRPSISGRFSPDFTDPNTSAYTEVQSDTLGSLTRVSHYQGMIYNYGGGQKQATLGVRLQNNFEIKKLKKISDSTEVEDMSSKDRYKYIKILENLTLSGNYNFAADSLNLSKFNVTASTKLFSMFTIQGNVTVDPYIYEQYDDNDGEGQQRRVNTFAWDVNKGIGNLERGTLSAGSTFSDKTFKKKNSSRLQDDEEVVIFQYTPYVDFSVPWSLNVNYNITYNQIGFNPATTFQSLSFRGTLGLTKKWQVSYSGAYDFESKEIVTPNLRLSRDLDCWIMNFNWVPFGPRKSYNFELHVKASVLKDLNLRRNRSYYDRER